MRFLFVLLFAAPVSAGEFIWDDFTRATPFHAEPGEGRTFHQWGGAPEVFDTFPAAALAIGGPQNWRTLSINSQAPGAYYLENVTPAPFDFSDSAVPSISYFYNTVTDREAILFRSLSGGGTVTYDFDFLRGTQPLTLHFYFTRLSSWNPSFPTATTDVLLEPSETPFSVTLAFDDLPFSHQPPGLGFSYPAPGESYQIQLSAVRVNFIPEPSTCALSVLLCAFLFFFHERGPSCRLSSASAWPPRPAPARWDSSKDGSRKGIPASTSPPRRIATRTTHVPTRSSI